MARDGLRWRIVLGSVALLVWFGCFSGGLLLETVEYRAYLAPSSFPDHEKQKEDAKVKAAPYVGSSVFAFFAAALWFTPTNLAVLALAAGLLGGCASNILVSEHPERVEKLQKLAPENLRYLQEQPWSAMIRSFVVYLCVIAGLYLAMDDPFKNSSPGQYTRLAGTVSILCFLVGYDPSRLLDWLGIVPRPYRQRQDQDTPATKGGEQHTLDQLTKPTGEPSVPAVNPAEKQAKEGG